MEFTLHTTIKASAKEIYESWLSSNRHSKMTGGIAVCGNKVGDSFTAWDGYISGKNTALKQNQQIIQSWRTGDFDKSEEDSRIEITLNEVNGLTELTLIHTHLPEHGEQYIEGWKEHYFTPMKKYFTK